MIKKIHFFCLLFISTISFCQTIQLSDEAKVSILTCGTGNESYSLYGHTGIRIKDEINNIDVVYNYGTFDFNTPNFILKFVKGDLQYFVSTSYYPDFEYSYRYENRSIYQQTLNLSQEKKQFIFDNLNNSLKSEERFYMYKFIDKNCTNMVVDKINYVLKDSVITTKKPVEISYREILFSYSKDHFFEQLGINIIFGAKVDKKADRLFLPFELLEVLKETKHNNQLLITNTETLFEAKPSSFTPSILNSIYTVIVVLLLIVLVNKKSLNLIYFMSIGLIGLFLCLVGFYSFHEEVTWNYNALLFNPLYLILSYYLFKENKAKIILIGKVIFGLHIIYVLYMLNKVHLYLLLPFIISHLYLVGRLLLSNKKR